MYFNRKFNNYTLGKESVIVFLLFLLLIIKTAFCQTILKGKVTNSAGLPLQGVNIIDLGSKRGATTDVAGTYSLLLFPKSTVVRFSHIGYATLEQIITDSIIEKSQNDTINFNVILIIAPKVLPEVNISAYRIERVYNKPEIHLLDYEFMQNNILLLIRYQNRYRLRLVDGASNTLFEKELDFTPEKLIKDCMGNIHLLTATHSHQISLNNTGFVFLTDTKAKYEQYLEPCVLSTEEYLFFREVTEHRQHLLYFTNNVKSRERKKFWEITDEQAKEYAESHYWEYINYYNQHVDPLDNIIELGLWDGKLIKLMIFGDYEMPRMLQYYEYIASRAIYAPLELIHDSLYLFDHVNDTLWVFDLHKTLKRKQPINYHHQKHWDEAIILSEEGNDVYARYKNNGIIYLTLLNLSDGRGIKTHKLSIHTFPEKIKIKDGYAYYLWVGKEPNDRQNLYRQRLD